MGIFIDTYGTSKLNLTDGEIAKKVEAIFDMRPYFIEQRLKLRNPIYSETAAYGHMGRTRNGYKTFFAPGGLTKLLKLSYLLGRN
jgi:S-adenosylmethionine synthetase